MSFQPEGRQESLFSQIFRDQASTFPSQEQIPEDLIMQLLSGMQNEEDDNIFLDEQGMSGNNIDINALFEMSGQSPFLGGF